MPVWALAPVEQDPEVTLTHWVVLELPNGDRHLVGFESFGRDGQGRVSSKIVTFDKDKMQAVTRSGRVYKLSGQPGWNADAEYVWNKWKIINSVTDFKNVTSEI